jgi:hypothetical protein
MIPRYLSGTTAENKFFFWHYSPWRTLASLGNKLHFSIKNEEIIDDRSRNKQIIDYISIKIQTDKTE